MLPQFLYADYKWLVDYSVAALVVNLLIMSLAWLWPAVYTQEFNLSLVWNLLAVIFTMYPLFLAIGICHSGNLLYCYIIIIAVVT